MKSEKAIHNILITRFPYESAWGGEEWHTIEIAKFLRQQGNGVFFMGSCPTLLHEFQNNRFDVKKIWGGKMAVTPWELLKFCFVWVIILLNFWKHLRWAKRHWNVDRVYMLSLNEKVLMTPIALMMGIKATWVEHQQIRGWLEKSPLRIPYAILSQKVEIIAIGRANQDKLLAMGIPESHLHEIPNGIHGEEFAGKARAFPREEIRIGCIARLIPKKGVHDMLEALKHIDHTLIAKRISVVINGRGPETEKLRSETKHLNHIKVEFHEYLPRDTYVEMVRNLDILIVPSADSAETFNIVTAEAMMSGIPVIITRACGIADYLHDHQDAIVIPPADPKAIQHAITELVIDKNVYENISKNAIVKAKQAFSFEDMARKYLEIITR